MAGILLGQMGDWYYDQLAKVNAEAAARNAARTAAAPATAATGTATVPANVNPTGAQIGQYYTSAMATDPRMAAIQRNISGEIPPDVKRLIAQTAAERGIATGSYGGGQDQTALLRALGLTSMDLTNRGISQYGEMYGQVPKLSPESLFISPTAQAQLEQTRQLEQARLAQEATLQSQRLATERELQRGRIASSEYMQSQNLAQEAGQFGASRADTLAGVAATNQRLDSMLGRLKGGNTWASYGGGVYGGAGTGAPAVTPGSSFVYGTVGTPYAGPSTAGTYYAGEEPMFSWDVPGLPEESPAVISDIPGYWPEGMQDEYYGQSWDYY